MEDQFMAEAIRLSEVYMLDGAGGPFGSVVVKDNKIIGRGWNNVIKGNDPTAHAEVMAIRAACTFLGSNELDGCALYTSCEPCPMCLGAIYWARLDKVYFANTSKDAAAVGFDDYFIYQELNVAMEDRKIPMLAMPNKAALAVFEKWKRMEDKREY